MDCSNRKVTELLPDYFSGHLSDDDLSLVEAHIAGCLNCQERLSVMELLSDNSERHSGSLKHITPDLLGRYYESKDSLDDSIISEIDAHLTSCKKCTRELDFLRGLEADLLAINRSEKQSTNLVSVMLSETWAALRRPAFAYALILLMLYPTIDWLRNDTNTSSEQIAEKVFFLTEQTRSEGDIPLVNRGVEESIIRLRVPFFHMTEEKQYEFLFTNLNADSSFGVELITNLDDKGSIQLLVNLRSLVDGSYLLNVVEIDRIDDGNRSRTSYPFRLETTR